MLHSATIRLAAIAIGPVAQPQDGGGMALLPAVLDISASLTFLLANSGASGGSGGATSDTSDQAVQGDAARSTYGVTGKGVRIGILSDSFNLAGKSGGRPKQR